MTKALEWLRTRFVALLIWVAISIGGTILPIAAVFFLVRIGGKLPTNELLFGEGQALLIASAIAADALGRLVSALGRNARLLAFSSSVCCSSASASSFLLRWSFRPFYRPKITVSRWI